jgi:hypothetical protein
VGVCAAVSGATAELPDPAGLESLELNDTSEETTESADASPAESPNESSVFHGAVVTLTVQESSEELSFTFARAQGTTGTEGFLDLSQADAATPTEGDLRLPFTVASPRDQAVEPTLDDGTADTSGIQVVAPTLEDGTVDTSGIRVVEPAPAGATVETPDLRSSFSTVAQWDGTAWVDTTVIPDGSVVEATVDTENLDTADNETTAPSIIDGTVSLAGLVNTGLLTSDPETCATSFRTASITIVENSAGGTSGTSEVSEPTEPTPAVEPAADDPAVEPAADDLAVEPAADDPAVEPAPAGATVETPETASTTYGPVALTTTCTPSMDNETDNTPVPNVANDPGETGSQQTPGDAEGGSNPQTPGKQEQQTPGGLSSGGAQKIGALGAAATMLNAAIPGSGPDEPETPGPVMVSRPISIDKLVSGESITEWYRHQFPQDATAKAEFFASMHFGLHPVTREGTTFTVNPEPIATTTVNPATGKIDFGSLQYEAGWYVLREVLSAPASDYFFEASEKNNGELYIYIGPNGVMTSVDEGNVDGLYDVKHITETGGAQAPWAFYIWMQLDRKPANTTDVEFRDGKWWYIAGAKPDGSGQALTTERFDTLLSDGSMFFSFCADLGASNVYGDYVFDEKNHNFSPEDMLFLLSVFDYFSSLQPTPSAPDGVGLENPHYRALAQVVLWNMILEVDGNAGYADKWFWDFDSEAKQQYIPITSIEGNSNWYKSGDKDLVNEILNDYRAYTSGTVNSEYSISKYIDLYNSQRIPGNKYLTGVVFIVGNGENKTGGPLPGSSKDQQRQIVLIYGESVAFTNHPIPMLPAVGGNNEGRALTALGTLILACGVFLRLRPQPKGSAVIPHKEVETP